MQSCNKSYICGAYVSSTPCWLTSLVIFEAAVNGLVVLDFILLKDVPNILTTTFNTRVQGDQSMKNTSLYSLFTFNFLIIPLW